MTRRFWNPKPSHQGRIGHPIAIERKLVRCAGVTFEDRQEGTKWTLRKYEAYRDQFPAMDVWTIQHLIPVDRQDARLNRAYGNQSPVPEEAVPQEVREFAIANLVRMRLNGQVKA